MLKRKIQAYSPHVTSEEITRKSNTTVRRAIRMLAKLVMIDTIP